MLAGVGLVAVLVNTSCRRQDRVENTPIYLSDSFHEQSGPQMVVVPVGTGTIGGKNFQSFQNEEPQYQIQVNQPYAIGAKEVTFAEFDRYCQTSGTPCPDDQGWGRGDQPVINVTWHDATRYTQWLSSQTGKRYRLPTEIEWEYAARAGGNTKFWWGNDYREGIDHCDRGAANCPEGTGEGKPVPAGNFQANPFGLYDVTSNVSEWVHDCYTPDHGDRTELVGVSEEPACSERVMKGGNWARKQPYVHLSARFAVPANEAYSSLGFRVVRELSDDEIRRFTDK